MKKLIKQNHTLLNSVEIFETRASCTCTCSCACICQAGVANSTVRSAAASSDASTTASNVRK